MIISKDLRIGNYLLKDGKIVEVAVINADNTIRIWNEEKTNTLGCFQLNKFEPIPLTEEWLLKFGFEKRYEDCFGFGRFILNNKFIMMDIDITVKLQFVHQLQNLYFALTGEELI